MRDEETCRKLNCQPKFYRKQRFQDVLTKYCAIRDFQDKKKFGLICTVPPKEACRRAAFGNSQKCERIHSRAKNECCSGKYPVAAWNAPLHPQTHLSPTRLKHVLGTAVNEKEKIWPGLTELQKNALDFRSMTRCDGWLNRQSKHAGVHNPMDTGKYLKKKVKNGTVSQAANNYTENPKIVHPVDYAPHVLHEYAKNPSPSLLGSRRLYEFTAEIGFRPKEFANLVFFISSQPKQPVKGNIVRPRHVDVMEYAFSKTAEEKRAKGHLPGNGEMANISTGEDDVHEKNTEERLPLKEPLEKFDQTVTGSKITSDNQKPRKS